MKRKKNFFLFYYIGGRYYDPASAICLDAAGVESVLCNCASFGGLDRNGIGLNPMWLAIYAYTVYCSMGELEQDEVCKRPPHKRSLLEIILIGVLLIGLSIALTAICSAIMSPLIADTLALTGQLIGGISMTQAMIGVAACNALSAIVINGVTAALGAAISGGNPWQAAKDAAVQGALIAFALTVIMFSITSVINAANIQSQCFAEGTPILTEEGSKPIEEIESGDKVWAYDEETGEKALKEVVRVFRNKASTSTTLKIKADNGTVDEITSTPGHKYYLPDNKRTRNANERLEHASYEGLSDKWVSACELKKGDRVLLANADSLTGKPKFGIVIGVKTEECEEFTTYNFEVADSHNYYVGKQGILVHNMNGVDCSGRTILDYNETPAYRGGESFELRATDNVTITKDGFVKLRTGPSVNTDIAKAAKFGTPAQITSLPDGLHLVQTGGDMGHFVIGASRNMTMSEYVGLLARVNKPF